MVAWNKIANWDYEVSEAGEVRSIKREIHSINGISNLPYTRIYPSKILKGKISKAGYKCVTLTNKQENKMYMVHRLVGIAFIKNEYNKPQINHIDGNKLNNDISNLEWNTQSENQKHAYKNNLQFGYKPTKLSVDEMSEMCEAHSKGIFTYTSIAKYVGMSTSAVRRIIIGETNGTKTRAEASSNRSRRYNK